MRGTKKFRQRLNSVGWEELQNLLPKDWLPKEMEKREAVLEFWRRVRIKSRHECWEWLGSINTKGYGVIYWNGKTRKAHRISHELTKGETGSLLVCHKCDNTKCVNPDHLFRGSCKDNTTDMIQKGRARFEDRHPRSKLKSWMIPKIREMKKEGKPLSLISHIYEVDKTTIRAIFLGKTWRNA